MKKVITLAFLSVLVVFFTVNNTFAEGVGGTVKVGIDFAGDHEISVLGFTGSEDVDTGVSLSAEFFSKINNNFEIGGGITFQIPRSQKDFQGDFYFIPLYGAIRVRAETEKVDPYFIGQLGYNFFDGDNDYTGVIDLEGGLYYGLGGGIIINKHFLIELLYSVNNGTGEAFGISGDVEYSKVTLNFGYNF